MVIPLNVYFRISAMELEELGALNAYLGIDNKVFVDPALLRKTEIPEFQTANEDLKAYFSPVITLLKASKAIGDIAWEEALQRLQFKEEHGASLGYSGAGSSGRGIGHEMASVLAQRAKQIVNLGIEDTEVFELIGLFQEDFGPDLLSDMAVSILRDRFFAYTQRLTTRLNLNPAQKFRFRQRDWVLPVHPNGTTAIVFVPAEILTPLPVALDRSEIAQVAEFNAEVRQKWNEIIAAAAKERREPSKPEIREMLLEKPQNLSDLIAVYKKAARSGYDFAKDPLGLFSWDYFGRTSAKTFPIEIRTKRPTTVAELRQVLDLITTQFKKNIEENKLYEVLYGESGRPRPEVFAQRLFYAIADAYCSANDVDLSREPNAGNGPVDFKLSAGYKGRLLVELKKSTNSQLLHGFDVQVEAYQRSEATEECLYLILRVADGKSGIDDVEAFRRRKLKEGFKVPDILVIDARMRPPASKR